MVFKVQDGIEFATRAEWRNYMMLTYYSFHDVKRSESPLIKYPGSIKGQMFDIINCEDSELIVMDSCEQVQIDHSKNCRIFIGASTSTVFIRNCQGCTIYCCCKQLRIRDCSDCSYHVYSMGEVHIEESSNLSFSCFNGGYAEHKAHLIECSLYPVSSNFWHSIYDHTPTPLGQPDNWRLLPEEENKEWFPLGECERAVSLTAPDTTTGVSNHHQVGQSYGVEQMRLDQENKKEEKATISGDSQSIEDKTSPLKTAATKSLDAEKDAKRVTLNLQPPTSPSESKGSVNRISHSKETSQDLGVTSVLKPYVSDEDELKVNQLGIEIALLVASARAKGIDVSVWLLESADNKLVPVPDFNSRFISLGLAVGIQEDFETKREIDEATSALSLSSIAAICPGGSDAEGVPRVDVHAFLLLAQAKVDQFLLEGQTMEEEASRVEEQGNVVEQSMPEPESEAEDLQVKVEEKLEGGGAISEAVGKTEEVNGGAENFPVRSHTAPARSRRTKCTSAPASSGVRGPTQLSPAARQSLCATTLEEMLMTTLKQPDLYHIIQVHLGYIKPYIMNLARGSVVVSSPRRWISVYDIEKAFSSARLHLSSAQIHLVMKNVNDFAARTGLDHIRTVDNEKEQEALELALNTNSIVSSGSSGGKRVAAVWLKRYLIHLKLGEGACNWVTWLDMKLSDTNYRRGIKLSSADKSKEFRKALAGLPHSLSEKEAEGLLQNLEILPPEALQQVVQHRLDNWELDTAGRRDFHHAVNVRFKKWTKDYPTAMVGKSKKMKIDLEKKTIKDIKKNLLNEKKQALLLSEKKLAAVTIEVFAKFDADNKKDKYASAKKFGEWLEKYLYSENQHLSKFREDMRVRNKTFGARQGKDAWLGSLNYIESVAAKVIHTLKSPLQHENRRNIIALRRQVDSKKGSRGASLPTNKEEQHLLVLRKDFCTVFDESFLKRMEDFVEESSADESALFFKSKEDAMKCAHDFSKRYVQQQSQQFEEWLEQKKEREKMEESVRNKENLQKIKDSSKKSSQAKKAFRKWAKLHDTNKYFSKTDKKAKAIPDALRASHNQAWRQETPAPYPEDNML